MKPRGIRNNNPGNIKMGSSAWEGEKAHAENTDGTFEQFHEMKYGVRAMTKLIGNYIKRDASMTLKGIINKYAPSSENNTNAYVQSVAKRAQINPNNRAGEWYNNMDDVSRFIDAMIYHENGRHVDMKTIKEGINLSGVL